MSVRAVIRALIVFAGVVCVSCAAFAQTSAQPQKRSTRSAPPTGVQKLPAPQVVTIVHRLNGLKMFRMLARSEEQVEAIARLDEAFNLTEDVHTSIIAGLAMEDGRTIVAWLPDAEVEFGPAIFAPKAPPQPRTQNPPPPIPVPKLERSSFPFRGGMFGSPDLTVIGPDGKRFAAEYVGLDGATGLSILRLSDANLAVDTRTNDQLMGEGENVRLLNPEPASNTRANVGGSLYVKMGSTLGRILSIKQAPAGGGVSRFKVRSPRLSLANIGGVAVNDAGETVGIVDAIEGPEATILPTALIRRAAKRVLTQHASVPRPWLGVKGEPVARLSVQQMKNRGWKLERAASLLERQRGILLTSIAPDSPAANASLRAGDVILQVNNADVGNDDDFSWMLDQAGPSTSVTFTLARPDVANEEAVSVKLSGLLDPSRAFEFTPGPVAGPSLLSQGIETIALKPLVAAQLGASSGLLVVYVDPSSPAFDSGLQPGDVIESIDGKPVPTIGGFPIAPSSSGSPLNFVIVRKKQKLEVILNQSDKKR